MQACKPPLGWGQGFRRDQMTVRLIILIIMVQRYGSAGVMERDGWSCNDRADLAPAYEICKTAGERNMHLFTEVVCLYPYSAMFTPCCTSNEAGKEAKRSLFFFFQRLSFYRPLTPPLF